MSDYLKEFDNLIKDSSQIDYMDIESKDAIQTTKSILIKHFKNIHKKGCKDTEDKILKMLKYYFLNKRDVIHNVDECDCCENTHNQGFRLIDKIKELSKGEDKTQ
jgi:hypothetical protein